MKLLKSILAAIRGKDIDRKCCEGCTYKNNSTGDVPTLGEEKFLIRNTNFAEFSWEPRYRYNQCTGITTGPAPNVVVDNGAMQYEPSGRNQNQYTGEVVNWPVFPVNDSPKTEQNMTELPISAYAQKLLDNSTCCHRVELKKDGERFTGIYNELSYWGLIFDDKGIECQKLETEWDEEEQELANFYADSFTLIGGYEIA